jgi:methylated-DNA-[protein]-cysteine S-methyltransferase
MTTTNQAIKPWVQRLCPTPLGPVRLLAGPDGLAGLWFEDQKHRPQALDGVWPHDAGHALLDLAQAQLEQYFSGQRQRFELPLDLSAGTAFQQTVWRALLSIEPGRTCSYAALAQHIGCAQAARAVGAAVGRNRLSVIVPCHRVVGQGGQLTGYAGGLSRKRALLALEGVA